MPYFEEEFEGLCQFIDLIGSSPSSKSIESRSSILERQAKSSLLARRPTKLFVIDIASNPAQYNQNLYRFFGLEKGFGNDMALQGQFHISTLTKL